MRKLRNEKGAITMITLLTILFMISFLMTSYMLIANKVKTQKEMLSETKAIYEPKSTMEEIYNSFATTDNVIPIYTVEQLLKIGSDDEIVIDGKIYTFSYIQNYLLKNDLEFNSADKGLENDWLAPYEDEDFKGNFDWSGHTIEVTTLAGDVVIYDGKYLVTSTGNLPMNTISDATKSNLVDYKIYGNSIQNGTPSPNTPVEIQSVGDKTVNLFDKSKWSNATETIFNEVDCLEIDDRAIFSYIVEGDSSTEYTFTFKLYRPDGYESKVTNLVTKDRNIMVNILHDQTYSVIVYGGEEIYFQGWNSTLYIDLSVTQIEKGTVKTEFEPYNKYKIPIKISNGTNETITNIYLDEPLRKVGNYFDYIDFENQKVYRAIGEYSFKGTENFTVSGTTTKTSLACYTGDITPKPKILGTNGICNIGHVAKYDEIANYDNGFFYNSNEMHFLKIQKSAITNYDDSLSDLDKTTLFKEHLANLYSDETPVKILYELETPTEETIELPEIQLYKGKNTITVSTEIQPSNISVTYNAKQ